MWEHRNGIAYDTLHPQRLAQLQVLQLVVRDLFQDGCDTLLPRDQRLFAKGLDILLKGSDCEMKQWITSVLLARQRSASAHDDYEASLRAERILMQRWLNTAPTVNQEQENESVPVGDGT
jgi:hypothetical protein